MSRNNSAHFSQVPRLNVPRTKMPMKWSLKTSFDTGSLVPIMCKEILPGDTVTVHTSKVVRLQTLLTPLMDNMYLDTYYFFVPNRLVWDHWEELMGENKTSAWLPSVEYNVPYINSPASTGWNVGTIADYFGIPTGVAGLKVNALPFRAYAKIVNDWFRDENLQDPLNVPTDDTAVNGVNTGTFVSDVVKGGLPYKAAKLHDYFTSALPSPQKGAAVEIGLGDKAPVYGDGKGLLLQSALTGTNTQKYFYGMAGSDVTIGPDDQSYGNYMHDYYLGTGRISVDGVPYAVGSFGNPNATSTSDEFGLIEGKVFGLADKNAPYTNGVYADLSAAGVISVNSLRVAFQVQKFYEALARGGSRYIEILKSMFGVTSPDARLQRPEYLGGNRVPINIHQVVQQSATDSVTPQGHVAGYSVTSDTHSDFTKSFVEHGYLIGLAVVRYQHTYQQGLEKHWSKRDRFDYYWPIFQNLGEQPILNKEIYAQGTDVDDEVFAYQEAWSEYRYSNNYCTGEMRSTYSNSLDVWHLGDEYNSLPTLSSSWIMEDKSNVDRVLAVTSSVSNQLFGDFFFDTTWTRRMPLYSVPGLVDHH